MNNAWIISVVVSLFFGGVIAGYSYFLPLCAVPYFVFLAASFTYRKNILSAIKGINRKQDLLWILNFLITILSAFMIIEYNRATWFLFLSSFLPKLS